MSKWLALIDDPAGKLNNPCDSVTNGDKTPRSGTCRGFCQVLSHCHSRSEVKKTGGESRLPKDMNYGFTLNGYPKTWTGNIVSLDACRQAPEWEKHGSTGRIWNGLTQEWEPKI